MKRVSCVGRVLTVAIEGKEPGERQHIDVLMRCAEGRWIYFVQTGELLMTGDLRESGLPELWSMI